MRNNNKHNTSIDELDSIARAKGGRLISRTIISTKEKLEWQCSEGHRWHATIDAIKYHDSWCHICANYTPKGTVGVVKDSPLINEWDFELNTVSPDKISLGSAKKVWWTCPQGIDHKWEASVSNRNKGRGCPYCAGKKWSVTNSLGNAPDELLELWDFENNEHLPDHYTINSGQKVFWKCPEASDHRWKRSINVQRSSKGCPFCLGKRVSKSNALEVLKPQLAKFWESKRNGPFKPLSITASSSKKLWWKCSVADDHIWRISPNSAGVGQCPFCSHSRPSSTYSLETEYPELASEWDYEKNDEPPGNYTPKSNKKVWWKCIRGHSYLSAISNRSNGKGCPDCNGLHSIPELRLYAELSGIFPKTKFRYRDLGKEIDVFIPEVNIGIEYDGSHWHSNKEKNDLAKNQFFENRLKLFRLREFPLNKLANTDVIVKQHRLDKSDIDELLQQIIPFCSAENSKLIQQYMSQVAFQRDDFFNELVSYFPDPFPEESLAHLNPDLAQEWHYELNHPLTPLNFTPGASFMAWWKCSLDEAHEWQSLIYNRHKHGNGCPICSGRTAGKRNNLKVLYPDIAAEFDDKKNDGLLTEKIMPKSAKVYWWTCPKGHSYQLPVYRRTEGRGCTICVPLHTPISYPIFEAFVPKTNQEKISAQKIKDEWDFNKNIGVNLNQIKIMSEKMFWWRCPNNPDHSYQARFVTRIRGDGNCPTCRYLTEADNSVAKLHPELMKEWDYSKNLIPPERFKPKSDQFVQWVCEKGHSYDAQIKAKTRGDGCPFCSSKRIIPSNSLEAKFPMLMKMWDFEKNDLSPAEIAPRTHKKVWWKCDVAEDHRWQAAVSNMTRPTSKCPFCVGKRASKTNSLKHNAPKLEESFDAEKNDNVNFEELTLGSNKIIWWKCQYNHSFINSG